MSDQNFEKLKERIEKLFRKAASTDSLQEAETFTAKAQELLAKYNIEKADLDIEGKKNNIDHIRISMVTEFRWNKTESMWLINLHDNVSRYNFCKVVSHGMKEITIIGEPHNIEMVRYICSNLVPTFRALLAKRWKEYQREGGHEKKNAFKRSYLKGAVIGLTIKLREQQEASKAEYTGMAGLIKLSDTMITEKMSELFTNLRNRTTRKLSAAHASAIGYQDGIKVNINRGISRQKPASSKLIN